MLFIRPGPGARSSPRLLDDLIGPDLNRLRHRQAERLRRLEAPAPHSDSCRRELL